MDRSVKILIWLIVAVVLFWVVMQVVSLIFSFVTWVVSMVITLVVIAVILYGAYWLLTSVLGGGGSGGTRSTDRDRIYE